ncbi:hypothetical protein ACFL20_08910 [Spirochaetota bacterium]
MHAIQTTLNINKATLKDITKVSNFSGKSRTEVIVMLLKKIMKNESGKACIHRTIKYQKYDDKGNWHTFHITFKGDEYEYFLDLRKLLKMSLSNIVAFAVRKYIKSIMSEESTDNYMFSNYILAKEDANGIIYWKLFWGIPQKVEEYLTFKDL